MYPWPLTRPRPCVTSWYVLDTKPSYPYHVSYYIITTQHLVDKWIHWWNVSYNNLTINVYQYGSLNKRHTFRIIIPTKNLQQTIPPTEKIDPFAHYRDKGSGGGNDKGYWNFNYDTQSTYSSRSPVLSCIIVPMAPWNFKFCLCHWYMTSTSSPGTHEYHQVLTSTTRSSRVPPGTQQ